MLALQIIEGFGTRKGNTDNAFKMKKERGIHTHTPTPTPMHSISHTLTLTHTLIRERGRGEGELARTKERTARTGIQKRRRHPSVFYSRFAAIMNSFFLGKNQPVQLGKCGITNLVSVI